MHIPLSLHTPAAIHAPAPENSAHQERATAGASVGGADIDATMAHIPRSGSASNTAPLDAMAQPTASAAQPTAATTPPAMQQVTEHVAERIKQARALRNQDRFSEALMLLGDDAALSALDRSELALWRGKVLQFSKDIPAALDALDEATAHADASVETLAQSRQLAYVIFQHAMACRAGSDMAGAFEKFARAEPYLRKVGDNPLYPLADRCDMYHNLAFIQDQRGMNEAAIAAYKALLPLRIQAGQPQPLGYTRARLGVLQCQSGEKTEGLENLRAGIALIELHGSKSLAQDYRSKMAAFD